MFTVYPEMYFKISSGHALAKKKKKKFFYCHPFLDDVLQLLS